MDKIEIYNFSETQLIAMDLIAYTPGITNKDIAKQLSISESTISAWRGNPAFIDSCYNRYIEINGNRLMSVMEAMFREAEIGSVPAAQLILKHYNKLTDKITIEIESPFEKYLRMENIQDGDVINITKDNAIEIGKSIDSKIELPPRDPSNNKPNKKYNEQKKALKKIPMESKKIADYKKSRRRSYKLRKRAQAVGLELLPLGRQTDIIKEKWEQKLYKLEKEMDLEN